MMYSRSLLSLFAAVAVTAIATPHAGAAEVCGDGIDNNSDGQTDEGCWPAGVTGVCEQPLSCARGGAIAPSTGNLVYRLPPDLTPKVPHGEGIAFQRVYMSQYEPGSGLPSTTDFKSPLGYGFQHNFMSWIELDAGDPILHTTTGQEVKFPLSFTVGSATIYFPQPGYHFKQFARSGTTGEWALTTLIGTVYRYNSSRKLYAIEAPGSAGDVFITYNADGQVDKVEHETGNKYLAFEYYGTAPKLLRYVKYYTTGSPDVLRSTVEFIYSSGKLTTVKIGDLSGTMTTVQSYSYDSDGYLSLVEDGGGLDIAGFNYVDGSSGKVARLETGDGDIGYEYSPDPMDCNGTYLFYHRDSATSCDADADCGTGRYCGGETDSSAADTGTCYQVRRCVEISSPNEDLITAVSAECNGGACPNAVDVNEYDWETGDGDVLIELAGEKSADNIWTSYLYDSYGMVTKMVEGDTDSDASTVPSTARVTWYFYDSNYPGLVTEVRRPSELKANPVCSDTDTTDCMRTLYIYNPNLAKVATEYRVGFTQELSGGSPTTVGEVYERVYIRNSYGQITRVGGSIAGGYEGDDDVEFAYHATGDPLLEGYVKEVKRKTGPSTYLVTTLQQYDHWGHPTDVERPDGTWTCLKYDDYRGFLNVRREAMAGQTSCGTINTSDLTTEYTYDTWGRLTKLEKPEGNCVHYEYDAEGRLEYVKPSDGCAPASGTNPHAMRHFYSIDGLLEKTEYTLDGTVTYRREQTHRPDRRIEKIINPESTSDHKLFDYHDDGMIKSITHEGSIGKDEFDYDDLNRREEIRRYEDSMSFDTWELLNALQLDFLLQVTDDDNKSLVWETDDFGRRIKQVSPDSGTTFWFYDEAGNLTTLIEADGTSGEVSHSFSYDPQYRLTDSDFEGVDCGVDQEPEIQRAYDTLPAGVSCPTGASCANVEGRLAYVKTMLFCDSGESDDTFDQETFFAYDDAGRVVETYVVDDSGRTAKTTYTWNKNGKLLQVGSPVGGTHQWSYDGTNTDSDADRIDEIVGVAHDVTWWPFGPVQAWEQYNKKSGKFIALDNGVDLAYRPEHMLWENTSGSDLFRIDWTLDEKGRTTVRSFSSGHADLQDAYFTFDDMDRVLCDSAATGSCPTSGTNLKSNVSGTDPYLASGERTELTHRSLIYGTQIYPYTYQTGSDQLATVGIGTGTREVTYTFDDRGNRTSEDDDGLSNDKRDFTYDGRGNLETVRGKYKPTSGSTWRYYTITYAYDERNHRIFKSFLDEDTGDEAHWFFYFDLFDRLIGVKHVPDIGDTSTYSIFRFDWLNRRPVYYQQTDYPGATLTRRYLHADELGRPLEAWSYPSSGPTKRVWAINPDVFGWDDIIDGAGIFQPLRFPGQLIDEDTTAWADFESPARPPLHDNHHRVYDPFTGMYLQTDPEIASTWSSYGYADQDPVGSFDSDGRRTIDNPDAEADAGRFGIEVGGYPGCNPFDTPYCGGPPNGGIRWVGGGGGASTGTDDDCGEDRDEPLEECVKPLKDQFLFRCFWTSCSYEECRDECMTGENVSSCSACQQEHGCRGSACLSWIDRICDQPLFCRKNNPDSVPLQSF